MAANTYEVSIVAQLTAAVVLGSDVSPAAVGQRVEFDGYNLAASYSDSSTPAVNVEPIDLSTAIGGSATDYDLTAAPVARDITLDVDLTGKRLVAYFAKASAANTGNVTIGASGANDYDLNGGDDLILTPGEVRLMCMTPDEATTKAAVGSSAKIIRVSGTSGDHLSFLAVFG